MSLHAKIMNIPLEPGCSPAYDAGHRDARHAAAEIALQGDEAIALLREFYGAIRERHHGRMPHEVEVAYDKAGAFLVCLDAQAMAKDAP